MKDECLIRGWWKSLVPPIESRAGFRRSEGIVMPAKPVPVKTGSGHPGRSRREQKREELDSRVRGNDGGERQVDFKSTYMEPLGLEPRVVQCRIGANAGLPASWEGIQIAHKVFAEEK